MPVRLIRDEIVIGKLLMAAERVERLPLPSRR
jgi:hypothetical protein